MKKIFSFVLLSLICGISHGVQASDPTSQPSSIPTKMPAPTQGIPISVSLTEDQANTSDQPINVPFDVNRAIKISLLGEESNSKVYCSGAGSQHGFRWEYDNGGVDNDILEMAMCPIGTIHAPFDPLSSSNTGLVTEDTSYQWNFWPKKVGVVTLTFKKYYYSNAMIQNLDGSLPWKDPVETIQFTINVVDDEAISQSSKNWQLPVPDKWPFWWPPFWWR